MSDEKVVERSDTHEDTPGEHQLSSAQKLVQLVIVRELARAVLSMLPLCPRCGSGVGIFELGGRYRIGHEKEHPEPCEYTTDSFMALDSAVTAYTEEVHLINLGRAATADKETV